MTLTEAVGGPGPATAQLGMHSHGSHDTFAVSTCLLQSELMQALVPAINEALAGIPVREVRCHPGGRSGAIKRISLRQGFKTAELALAAANRSQAPRSTQRQPARWSGAHTLLEADAAESQHSVLADAVAGESVLLQLTTRTALSVRERGAVLKVAQRLQGHTALAGIVQSLHSKRSTAAPADREELLHGQDHVFVSIQGLVFKASAASFLQVNNAQCASMYSAIQAAAALRPGDTVVDLYCGAGTISVWLARHCAAVTGVDVSHSAIADARVNAKVNGVRNAEFHVRDLARDSDVEACLDVCKQADVIVVDPARAGLSEPMLQVLAQCRARTIVYASCWAQSFCRDLRDLQQHGWECESVCGIDMFPQTDHCETVAKLVQRA